MDKRNYNLPALLSIMVAMLLFKTTQGQYIKKQADSQAGLYNYAEAIPLYEKAYKKKATSAAARGVADSYRLMSAYTSAEPWYAKLVTMPDHTAADEIHYAGILMNNSKYAAAKEVLDSYLNKKSGDKTAENMRSGCDSAAKWLPATAKGTLDDLKALNSQWSDWGTAFNRGVIIFASDRPYDSLQHNPFFSTTNIRKKYYGWTGNSYLHLYESNGQDSSSTKLLPRNINGDYHSANASYTADGRKLYYAVTDLKKKGRTLLGKDEPYTLNVEVVEEQWDSAMGRWQQSSPFPYNNIFNYPVGDPFISPDGRELYFVADYGNKGYGGTDIYYSHIDENGKWQSPVNMGPEINTPGNERTPAFDKAGTFYFASDGQPGIGGLDIYKAIKTSGHWVTKNMGIPVNSPQDDFAPALDSTTVYFSSNRPGGKGNDDIYRFIPARILLFSLSGNILDKKTNKPLSNAEVTINNKETGVPLKAVTDEEGKYHVMLDSISSYELSVAKTDYNSVTGEVVTTKGLSVSRDLRYDAMLEMPEKAPEKIPEPQPAPNKTYKLENVYFDVAKADIKPGTATELNKLVKLLQDNPAWNVEIATHTDSRASDSYNLKLSQRRAESIVAYLIGKGIAGNRLVAKGYGETRLLNRCANGVRCSEEEHLANRRTEFTILDK
jgi:outer membrane protein OmpA-like peptidoglycan-associated protein